MSDPMTNTEIEDVLSSIRRLVSEELRPHPRPVPAGASDGAVSPTAPRATLAVPGQAGKLLLTPALRVVSEGEGQESAALAPEAAMAAALQAAGLADPAVVLAEPADTALPVISPVISPVASPVADDADFVLMRPENPDVNLHRDWDRDDLGWGDDAARAAHVHDDVAAEAPAVQQVVARLGAAVLRDDEWESPVGDLDDFGAPVAEEPPPGPSSGAGFGRPEPLGSRLHLSVPESAPESAPESVPVPEPVSGPSLGAGADDADFLILSEEPAGAALADDDFLLAEDEVAAGPAAPHVFRRAVPPPGDGWADAAEAEVRAELERGRADEAGETAHVMPELAFDEEVLRDLVRDIIREELAGSLGERITRNVRKLVRTEIARAHAVRDFE